MAKVITFSRVFPAYHPRAGGNTYFVEQIWNGLNEYGLPVPKNSDLPKDFMWSILPLSNFNSKVHTIRAGKRWKAGDKFSPRVWSGKPYNSKQIIIAPDIEIKKVWDIGLRIRGDFKEFYCNDCDLIGTSISEIAKNDGLTTEDLFSWFNKPFEGQIICWSDVVQY